VTPSEPGSRPALVMLSAHEFSDLKDIPEEILSVATRRNLEICPVHSIHLLEERLHEVQPVALAWDMYNALPGEWNIIQRLFSHPNLAGLPLILFGYDSCTSGTGVTNVFLKPFAGKKLSELIESLRPQDSEGTVLIADDDPQAAAMYCAIVKESLPGCSAQVASDGQEALDYLRDNQPAIVILDLLMPKVNGFEVLEKLRADPRKCRTPVIVLSGKMLTFEDVTRLNYPNVVFHSKGMLTPEEIAFALQKTVSSDIKVGQPTSRLVKQALAFLHQNYERAISRSELAETVGVSDNYLTQIFHQELGLSPIDCLNRLRILKARELLDTSDLSISMVAVKVGFDDPAYFSRVFRKLTGKSPNGYRMQK